MGSALATLRDDHGISRDQVFVSTKAGYPSGWVVPCNRQDQIQPCAGSADVIAGRCMCESLLWGD